MAPGFGLARRARCSTSEGKNGPTHETDYTRQVRQPHWRKAPAAAGPPPSSDVQSCSTAYARDADAANARMLSPLPHFKYTMPSKRWRSANAASASPINSRRIRAAVGGQRRAGSAAAAAASAAPHGVPGSDDAATRRRPRPPQAPKPASGGRPTRSAAVPKSAAAAAARRAAHERALWWPSRGGEEADGSSATDDEEGDGRSMVPAAASWSVWRWSGGGGRSERCGVEQTSEGGGGGRRAPAAQHRSVGCISGAPSAVRSRWPMTSSLPEIPTERSRVSVETLWVKSV